MLKISLITLQINILILNNTINLSIFDNYNYMIQLKSKLKY